MEGPDHPPQARSDPGPPGRSDQPPPPPLIPELGGSGQRPLARSAGAPASAGAAGDIAALLRNRFIVAGLAGVALLLLVTIVLVLVNSDDENNSTPNPGVVISTPVSGSTLAPRGGLAGRATTALTMRSGPAANYAVLGTVPRGAAVTAVGRNADETWLQIAYPAGSQLRGWVDATFINVTGNVSQLAIAGPNAGPSVPLPAGGRPLDETPEPEATFVEEFPTETQELETPTEEPQQRTPRPTRTPRPPTPTPQNNTPTVPPPVTQTPIG